MSQLAFFESPVIAKPVLQAVTKQINPHHFGLSGHPLKARWWSMWQRCTNPGQENYPAYGGRGIRVADEWAAYLDGQPAPGFLHFLRDMEASWPGPGFDLDRIDPDGDYCKANCRWLDKRQNVARANRSRFGMKYRTRYRA